MVIIILAGTLDWRNLGDALMANVAAQRLSNLFPAAQLYVTGADPLRAKRHCPRARPVPVITRSLSPLQCYHLLQQRSSDEFVGELLTSEFFSVLRSASQIVVAGMGAITDSFFGFAAGILMIMDYALNHGINVAMMGQGLGPLEPGILRECAGEALRRVPTIGLREAVFSVPLLESLGIGKDQYAITGDDAIEPAYESRPEHLGTAIGLCIRISEYSSLDVTTLHRIGAAAASFAESRHTDVLPVPIWFGPDSDLGYFNLIAAGHGRFVHGDASLEDHRQLLQQISRCRVVVTAAYHAAVFALSQGISVVAITGCAYYEQKFLGLAAMFEYGCTVIRVDSELERSVMSALSESWARAPEWRNSLLAHAQHQIHCGQKLYRDLASTNFAQRAIQPSIVS